MRIQRILLATGLILVAATTAAHARDSPWTLRFHGALLDSSAETSSRVGGRVSNTVDAGGGFGVGVEYRVSERLGLEFSTLFAGLQIEQAASAGTEAVYDLEMTMMPLTLAVPFHFGAGQGVDLFVGPTFSVIQYLDMETYAGSGGTGTGIEVDTDTSLGAAFGIDVPIGRGKWAFSAGLRYMASSPADVDLDPVIVTLGFAYRF